MHLRTSAEFHSRKVIHFLVEAFPEEGVEDVRVQDLQHSCVHFLLINQPNIPHLHIC